MMSAEKSNLPAESRQTLADAVEEFGGGDVSVRHGYINTWLIVVYLVMCVWALYYGIAYWGGLGPGLDY